MHEGTCPCFVACFVACLTLAGSILGRPRTQVTPQAAFAAGSSCEAQAVCAIFPVREGAHIQDLQRARTRNSGSLPAVHVTATRLHDADNDLAKVVIEGDASRHLIRPNPNWRLRAGHIL